jgi:hypothetical protein
MVRKGVYKGNMIDPMAVVNGAREIAELVKKYNDVPLYDKIVALQTQVVELATERLQLFSENTTLKDKLDKRAKTEFRDPYYYQEGDQTPLCPNCFDTSAGDLRVHLPSAATYSRGFGRLCRNCEKLIVEGPRKTPVGGPIRGI